MSQTALLEIGVEEIKHTAVFTDHGGKEQFGLTAHRRAQCVIKRGIPIGIGCYV